MMKNKALSHSCCVWAFTGMTAVIQAADSSPSHPAPQVTETAPASLSQFRSVSFEELFPKDMLPPPLSMDIPSGYQYAQKLSSLDASSSWWTLPEETLLANDPASPLVSAGSLCGKASANTLYDASTGKFSGEEEIAEQLKSEGSELLAVKKISVGGHPVWACLVRFSDGGITGNIFVATMIGSNVLQIGYSPPGNDLGVAQSVWGHMVESIR